MVDDKGIPEITIIHLQQVCTHSVEFQFNRINDISGWYCEDCSFYLNFDPCKFEDSISIVESTRGGKVVQLVGWKGKK